MKKLVTALLIFSPYLLFSQEEPTSTLSKFRIGISGSADYCYRTLIAEDTTGIGSWYLSRNETEIPAIGWSAGVTASYSINDRWSVDAGLKYTLNRYKSTDITFTDATGQKIGDGYFAYLNRYISIPIGIHRSFGIPESKSVRFLTGATVIPEYALGVWTRGNYNLPPEYSNISHYSKDSNTNYNEFILSGSVEAGFEITSGKFTTQILPNVKISAMKQAKQVNINRRLWSTGAEFRVLYSI